MSASESDKRGGHPSTTQPMAGPWLSPQVVTRKRWPKLLWDMVGRSGSVFGPYIYDRPEPPQPGPRAS
jgi:hypothetical protein